MHAAGENIGLTVVVEVANRDRDPVRRTGVDLPWAELLLPVVLAGMMLVGIGTFFAQAAATGFVGLAATSDRDAASGMYLASYFAGGLAGSALLGQVFDRWGWAACVGGIGLALIAAAILTRQLRERDNAA